MTEVNPFFYAAHPLLGILHIRAESEFPVSDLEPCWFPFGINSGLTVMEYVLIRPGYAYLLNSHRYRGNHLSTLQRGMRIWALYRSLCRGISRRGRFCQHQVRCSRLLRSFQAFFMLICSHFIPRCPNSYNFRTALLSLVLKGRIIHRTQFWTSNVANRLNVLTIYIEAWVPFLPGSFFPGRRVCR